MLQALSASCNAEPSRLAGFFLHFIELDANTKLQPICWLVTSSCFSRWSTLNPSICVQEPTEAEQDRAGIWVLEQRHQRSRFQEPI